jgi:hypothetical protein
LNAEKRLRWEQRWQKSKNATLARVDPQPRRAPDQAGRRIPASTILNKETVLNPSEPAEQADHTEPATRTEHIFLPDKSAAIKKERTFDYNSLISPWAIIASTPIAGMPLPQGSAEGKRYV